MDYKKMTDSELEAEYQRQRNIESVEYQKFVAASASRSARHLKAACNALKECNAIRAERHRRKQNAAGSI